MSVFRRRRAQPVSLGTGWVPDTSSADSHADYLNTTGATQFSSLPQVPRSGVRRLLDLAEVGSDRWILDRVRGKGGDQAPLDGFRRRSPVVRVGPSFYRPRFVTSRPLQAIRRADWRAFQKLQVRRPSRDMMCVRRLQRKQVLFAKKVAGRRGGSPGPYRRNQFSNWSC